VRYSVVIIALFCISSSRGSTFGSQEQVDPALFHVSKIHSLGRFIPKDLVQFGSVQVSKRIVSDLRKLLQAARRDGLQLKVVSGYRSYDRQRILFNRYVENELKKDPKISREGARKRANRYSAVAGHSEHQLGTAVDVLSAENGYSFSADKTLRHVSWLEKNAARFHFKISYPEHNKEYEYEPWHIRWFPH
jgi:D-alanyl-D-alanine carboxypeptidase